MRKQLKRSAVAFALGAALTAHAQATCTLPDGRLNLSQAVEHAFCANPSLRASRFDAEAAAADADRARAAYRPSVSATTSVSIPEEGASSSQYGVALNWLLFDFGERAAKNAAARAVLSAAESTAQAQAQDLALSVAQVFFQVQAAEAAVNSALAQEVQARQALRVAKARYAVGDVPRLDELQARSTVAQAQHALAKARGSLATQRAALATLLGVPADEFRRVAVDGASTSDTVATQTPQALADMVQRALAFRADLDAARSRLASLDAQTNAARAQHLPTVSLSANLSRSNPARGASIDNRAIGFTVSIPLYSGGATDAQVRSLTAQAEAQKERLAAAEAKVAQEVVSAVENVTSSAAQLEAALALSQAAAEAQEQSLARYQGGVGTSLEMLDAMAKNAAAAETLINARLAAQLARVQLARSIGQMPVR